MSYRLFETKMMITNPLTLIKIKSRFRCYYLFKLNPSKIQLLLKDPAKVQSKLGRMAMNVIEAKLKNDTQLAKIHMRLPFKKHRKSSLPQLKRN